MKQRISIALAIVAGAGAAATANADLVAHWNFNNSTPNTTSGQLGVLNSTAPDSGSGSFTIGGGSPTITFNTNSAGTANGVVGTFSGTLVNAVGADVSGGSLVLQGGVGGSGGVTSNGGYAQFQLDLTNYMALQVSFATRGTSTGFRVGQLSYSTDGSSFTNFGPAWDGGASSTFFLLSRDLTTETSLNGDSSVFIRLTLSGATGSSGNNRIDNLQFNATRIPAPGALALLGVGGLIAARRRRA